MTSTVSAKIKKHITIIDIFKCLFPCGSITGIPKKATMDIISELETTPREIYCGAIGYITPNNEAVFNVPIRTVFIDKQKEIARYGVGGAITKDSTKENEYEEILTKTQLLTKRQPTFNLLETFRLKDGEYFVFDEHIRRLEQSSLFFDFSLHITKIKDDLMSLAQKYKNGQWKVRLISGKHGDYSIKLDEINVLTEDSKVMLSKNPIDHNNLFLYHKTTNRSIYEINQIKNVDLFDTLLWNKKGEITEFTTGNIVVQIDESLYTPPVDSGLLPGTFRESLLKNNDITERKIMVDELDSLQNIWFINSVREWILVQLI
jgi:para-aminobenzoate synthetase/4-amino-4-deoxychorismate lyase